MQIHLCENTTFKYNGKDWQITNTDYEDDDYPYECYPTQCIQKAKELIKNNDAYDSYKDLLNEWFIDERICFSKCEIQECIYEEKIRVLENRIKELESSLQ